MGWGVVDEKGSLGSARPGQGPAWWASQTRTPDYTGGLNGKISNSEWVRVGSLVLGL